MRGAPFDTLKLAMYDLIQKMDPRDQLSVVSYSSDCSLDLAMVPMEPANKELARLAVETMRASGGTNLSSGLMLGLEELAAADADTAGADAAVMLLTDGKPTVGVKSARHLATAVRMFVDAHLDSYSSVKMYTFGLGTAHDRHMLFTLSNESCRQAGCYYSLESADAIGPSFNECLTSLQTVVAQDAVLTIKMAECARLVGCHTRYPVRELDEGAETRPTGGGGWTQSKSSGGFVPGRMAPQLTGNPRLSEKNTARGASISLGHLPICKKIDILVTVELPMRTQEKSPMGTTITCALQYVHAHSGAKNEVTSSLSVPRHDPKDVDTEARVRGEVVGKVNEDVEYWRNVKTAADAIDYEDLPPTRWRSGKRQVLTKAIDTITASVAVGHCAQLLQDLEAHLAGLDSASANGSAAVASAQPLSVKASSVRKGQLLLHKGRTCRVEEMNVSKTGKHGSAKVFLKLRDVVSLKASEEIFPALEVLPIASDPNSKPVETTYRHDAVKRPGDVTVFEVALLSIDEDEYVTFLDGQGGVYAHLKLPEHVPEPAVATHGHQCGRLRRNCRCGSGRLYKSPAEPEAATKSLRQEIAERHENGEDLLLILWQMHDSEKIVAVKAAPDAEVATSAEVAGPTAAVARPALQRELSNGGKHLLAGYVAPPAAAETAPASAAAAEDQERESEGELGDWEFVETGAFA